MSYCSEKREGRFKSMSTQESQRSKDEMGSTVTTPQLLLPEAAKKCRESQMRSGFYVALAWHFASYLLSHPVDDQMLTPELREPAYVVARIGVIASIIPKLREE